MTVSTAEHSRRSRTTTAEARIRIARPSKGLAAVRRLYTDGLGLAVLFEKDGGEGKFALVMPGTAAADRHLELTVKPIPRHCRSRPPTTFWCRVSTGPSPRNSV